MIREIFTGWYQADGGTAIMLTTHAHGMAMQDGLFLLRLSDSSRLHLSKKDLEWLVRQLTNFLDHGDFKDLAVWEAEQQIYPYCCRCFNWDRDCCEGVVAISKPCNEFVPAHVMRPPLGLEW